MSVSLYNLFAQSCTSLASSIILKDEAVARAMNKYDRVLDFKYGLNFYNEYDPKTWRYYLHLSGQYHPLDSIEYLGGPGNKIRVTSIDTVEEIDFTIENLRDHRATWSEYQKGSTYYQNLVNKYPKLTKLIDGILNPIDIKKAINAREYQILQYDKRYIESNEVSLIERVQQYIDWYFGRYDNPDYEKTDNLYVAAKIGVLYTFLPYVIMQLRYEKARTIEAHSFHVWQYLGSHQFLDVYKDHLNLYQRMWFYRNIKWVEANPGKMDTFEKLIDVVMTNRQLPIAEFYTNQIDTEMEADNNVFYPDVTFNRSALNLHDVITKAGSTRTIEEMVEKEVQEATQNKRFLQEDKEEARHRLTRSGDKTIPSKMLESFATDASKRQPIKLSEIEINEWIYMTTQGLYTAKISINNPKTSDVLSLSQDEALVLFIYAFIKSNGIKPIHIPTITAVNVLKRNRPSLEHVRTMIDERYTHPIYVYAANEYTPYVTPIISTAKFSEFCQEVWEAKKIHRNLWSFQSDYRQHIQIKQMTDQYFETVVCKLTERDERFDAYFKAKGWELAELDEGEWKALWGDILSKATGSDLVKSTSLREIQSMMIRLMKQLSSYSVQFLKTINEEEITVIDWPYMRVWSGYTGNGFTHREGDDDIEWINGVPYNSNGEIVLGYGIRNYGKYESNTTNLDFRNHRVKIFNHEKNGIIDFPLNGSNGHLRVFHSGKLVDKTNTEGISIDDDNLILGMKDQGVLRMRTSLRMPSNQMYYSKLVINTPTVVEDEDINPWDLEQFRIHATTEDKSRVIVDEKGNLITRGVVYVKRDYTGKQ